MPDAKTWKSKRSSDGSLPTWLTPEVESIAATIAETTTENRDEWQQAIERSLGRLQGAELSAVFWIRILPYFSSTGHLLWLSEELCGVKKYGESPKRLWQNMQSHMSASGFSLQDWVSAFETMHTWLSKRQKKAPLSECFSYICCCEEASTDQGVVLSLDMILEDFLESQGFQASR